jgi:hypothetical protein
VDEILHNEVRLEVPSGWSDQSQILAVGPAEGKFRPNLVVSLEGAHVRSASGLAAQALANLKKTLAGYSLVKEGPAQFGSTKGFLREHTFTMNGQKLAQLQYHVVQDGRGYTVTYTHLASRMAATRGVAEEAFKMLEVGGT